MPNGSGKVICSPRVHTSNAHKVLRLPRNVTSVTPTSRVLAPATKIAKTVASHSQRQSPGKAAVQEWARGSGKGLRPGKRHTCTGFARQGCCALLGQRCWEAFEGEVQGCGAGVGQRLREELEAWQTTQSISTKNWSKTGLDCSHFRCQAS